MVLEQYRKRITASTTTTVVPVPCSVRQISISPKDVASAWKLRIQDQSSPPFVLVPDFTLAVPADGKPTVIKFDDPARMDIGVDAVTSGTAAGELGIEITVAKGQPIPT